jgi:trk system potassium uptake protein
LVEPHQELMKCAVIGLGEFGKAAAVGLVRYGAEVIAADIDMDRVNDVKDDVSLAVRLDASQDEALEAHGIGEVDVLIAAIGDNFEAQVLVVVHAKRFGIKKIVARATTPDHIRVLKAVGADEVFNPEEDAARWMVQRLLITNISSYFELAEGFSIVEVNAPAGVIGQSLEQLNLRRRFRINLVAIKRTQTGHANEPAVTTFNPVPLPDEVIQSNDVLALVGSVLHLANFMAEYT